MRPAIIPVLALLFLATGCSTPYSTVLKQYNDAPACCTGLKDLPYEPLRIGDKKDLRLDATSPAYDFNTGKSFFKAFALPSWTAPYTVTVESYMQGDHIKSAYIFFPRLITLDEDFRVVRQTDPAQFHLRKAGMGETWGIMYKWEGSIAFTDQDRNERYLVVLTTKDLMKSHTLITTLRMTPFILPGLVGAIPLGKEDVLVPHSPAGRVVVTVTSP